MHRNTRSISSTGSSEGTFTAHEKQKQLQPREGGVETLHFLLLPACHSRLSCSGRASQLLLLPEQPPSSRGSRAAALPGAPTARGSPAPASPTGRGAREGRRKVSSAARRPLAPAPRPPSGGQGQRRRHRRLLRGRAAPPGTGRGAAPVPSHPSPRPAQGKGAGCQPPTHRHGPAGSPG